MNLGLARFTGKWDLEASVRADRGLITPRKHPRPNGRGGPGYKVALRPKAGAVVFSRLINSPATWMNRVALLNVLP